MTAAVTPELLEVLKDTLYNHMSEISEEHYCAGWMSGNERRLWSAMTDPTDDRAYGMGTIDDADIRRLRMLHEAVDGWWYWHDDRLEPNLPNDQWGPRFLTTAQWLEFMRTEGTSVRSSE